MEDGLTQPDPLSNLAQAPEQRFQLLVESVQDYAIFMLDTEGIVRSWNAGAQRLKGYRASEIIGQSFQRFYPAEVIARGWPLEELRRAAEVGRIEDEGWRLRQDGSRFWASVVITALRDRGGTLQGFAKVTRDLTERRAHEEALRQSEEQLRLLVGAVDDYAIFMLNPRGEVLTWNAGAQRIKGYAEHEVVGRHFSMFFTQEDAASGVPSRELELAARAGRAEAEGWRVRKNGEVFWANVIITPALDSDGVLRGFAKVTRDLSEQRRMTELEKSSRRMEQFLAMLAHELRNPLAPLRNAVEIMGLRGGLPPYMTDLQDLIDRQTRQLTRLVDDLLDVARITTGKISLLKAPVDWRDVILSGIETVRPQLTGKQQSLSVDLPDEVLRVTGDSARLAQAFQNVLLSIGLAPDALERIFNLFAQEPAERDPSNSGLGIGLSLARKVMELHGGTLTAQSAGLGQGSTFTLSMPAGSEDAPASSGPLAAPSKARRVLVIDDNVDSTDSMVMMLRLLGHVSEGAYAGPEGLARAETFRPEVVLLDLNMPGMDGFSVMKRLRLRFGRDLIISAMTGYARQSDRRSTLESGFDAHLIKPVGLEELQRVFDTGSHLELP